jgi:epoxide hydrolase-like protein
MGSVCAEPRAFQLRVADEVLTDLAARLSRIRWPDEAPEATEAWQFGTDLTYLRKLVGYWRDEYDWRAQEALLNAFPQYMASVGGIDLHFWHVLASARPRCRWSCRTVGQARCSSFTSSSPC